MVDGSVMRYFVSYQHKYLLRSFQKIFNIPFICIFVDKVVFCQVEIFGVNEVVFDQNRFDSSRMFKGIAVVDLLTKFEFLFLFLTQHQLEGYFGFVLLI